MAFKCSSLPSVSARRQGWANWECWMNFVPGGIVCVNQWMIQPMAGGGCIPYLFFLRIRLPHDDDNVLLHVWVAEYSVLWGGYLVTFSLLLWCNFRLSKRITLCSKSFFKVPFALLGRGGKDCLSKYQHCSSDLLISSFHLWQKEWDAALGLLKAGGGWREC